MSSKRYLALLCSALLTQSLAATATILDPGLNLETVTSTDLPITQTPTSTFATQSAPDTIGTLASTLETAGNPVIQPFPTSVPSESSATLQPLSTFPPFDNATSVAEGATTTQTVTVPTITLETIVASSTVATLPVETLVTFTSTTAVKVTSSSEDYLSIATSTVTTVIISTSIFLEETTATGSTTFTTTLATTVTTDGIATAIPTSPTNCSVAMGCRGQDVFLPVALGEVPANIFPRSGHPVPRLGIKNMVGPIETNKFYANFLLGSQGSSSFVVPYSLSWSKGSGNAMSWGMAISHVDADQKVFGPNRTDIPRSPASYYIDPIGIQSIILSAAELGSATVLTSDSLRAFSANIHLQPQAGSSASITFPVVQGMGFVTGLYSRLQPAIQSSVFFRKVESAESPKPGIFKYRIALEDGKTWLLYAIPGNGVDPNFRIVSSTLMQGLPHFSGSIQIAKNPLYTPETVYDNAAGVYPTSVSISGYANGNTASYNIKWNKGGQYANSTTLLMFALPHHLESFVNTTKTGVTPLQLQTTVKGLGTAVMADSWTLMEDNLPIDMGFAPWRPDGSGYTTISTTAIQAIRPIAAVEVSENMSAQTNLDSMYFSGKGLSKFATLLYAMNDLTNQQGLAAAGLVKLKDAFAVFTNNQQQFPLVYDTDWKGIVSSASYVTGDPGVDFGNSYYNDHHFHYGYFIHAAAVIGYLDPSWLAENRDYVNTLVRDVANPSAQDQFFPVFRSFDWYNGHSWAKGLYESADGKDQESSSEDAMFAYALKMWGKTTGDPSMEARGNLMLSVLTRSLRNYFLLETNNINHPENFIGNKVTGIMFENKVDHTTYFGNVDSYIQGIHMIPLMPFSTMTRSQDFVSQEFETYFSDGRPSQASDVQGGWRGILYANLAIVNPTAAYNFFSQEAFDSAWIDGGATRTWYLILSAGK